MAEVVLFPLNANDPNLNPSLIDPPALLAESSQAREIIIELEHELNDAKYLIADQAIAIFKHNPRRRRAVLMIACATSFLAGWVLLDQPKIVRELEMSWITKVRPEADAALRSDPSVQDAMVISKTGIDI